MTTIAALAVDDLTVVGADSLTNVYDRPIPAARKIRRLTCAKGGDLLLAFCGAGALCDLIEAKLGVDALPTRDEDPQPWAAAIAWAVSDLAFDARLTDGGQMDGSILLAAVGHLWTLSNYGAIYHPDGVAALGSGEGPAIGALDVLRQTPGLEPREAVERAVRIGIGRDKNSGLPVQMELLLLT